MKCQRINPKQAVDLVVYNEFKKKYDASSKHESYSYDFICDCLKNIDYYGTTPYEYFTKLSKDEYVDTCDDIKKNNTDVLKQI